MKMTSAPTLTVFAIDPGATSGFAVVRGDRVLGSGTAKCAADRRRILDTWGEEPDIIVREDWTRGGKWGFKQVLGMGAAWGHWEEALELAGLRPLRVKKVLPNEWRLPLLGRKRLTREQWKREAIGYVDALGIDAGSDESEAICIGLWATRSDAVWEALTARERRRIMTEAAA
jgi:hypothetical protein